MTNPHGKKRPVYLFAGGRRAHASMPDPLMEALFKASGKQRPSIAYIGAASGDDRTFFQYMESFLHECGAGTVTLVPTAGKKFSFGKTSAMVESADIVCIGGGDVEAGMEVLHRTKIIPLLRQCHENGTLFFGFSAGSIMLAQQWITWDDEDDDSTAHP
ncbi:MAG: Type 1 glutamine amidotransferase-like domain-containing protein, partial [Chitinivibrionales bacterium]|nr:Type 1 glutamine amidotransferase-like domain-containing protein [Chitinivibrionales bacterium]